MRTVDGTERAQRRRDWLSLRVHPGQAPIRRRRARGQSLVEFAIIVPVFILLLVGTIEFGFVFNATMTVNFATRDASLIAAEAGSDPLADCTILQLIEGRVTAPTDRARIRTVSIFKASRTGTQIGGADTYTRGGSTACGTGTPVPYTATSSGYPPASRCNDIQGCPVVGQPGVVVPLDTIGVTITYRYPYHTPINNIVPLLPGGTVGYFDMTWSNVMRMEPIL